ncbi:MAG: phage tail sheath family protein [Anaerolineaceae bacterium]|nr:phage tail sheath family protein [Anaerolineaceae bacterium]
MAQYLSPGVYVEEVPSAIKPIAGVGTSTAAFIGVVADNVTMPAIPGQFERTASGKIKESNGQPVPLTTKLAAAGEATLLTSWDAFRTNFGDFQAGNSTLAHAVYGFFNNGGTRCWVTRLANEPVDATAVTPALAQFEAIDEIALVAVPGTQDTAVQTAVIDHCAQMEDRFAILDGQQNAASTTVAAIKGSVGNSNYAAMYYPWIQVLDPVTGQTIDAPPSGHIAGLYARVDATRGVFKAPANELIRGAIGVSKRLSKADQDGLNPEGINAIRVFNGSVTVWGGRTLGGDANNEWKYISSRRFMNFLRESIDQGTQWVVLEPNTPDLWARIRRNVGAFLDLQWRAGALFGNTPAEAFYVRCDETTNPPNVREQGMVVTEIGIAIVQPAEFVIFRVSQWTGPGQ